MADDQEARLQGEEAVLAIWAYVCTFIRPWYVVGPGHYWPLLFQPVFKLLEVIPSTSARAKALALVSLKQMLLTLRNAVINIPQEMNIIVRSTGY